MTIKESFDALVQNARKSGATPLTTAKSIMDLQVALEDKTQKVPEDILSGTDDEEKRIILNALCALFAKLL